MSTGFNLYLIGPRGAGKTSAGKIAALQLGVSFVDTDAVIEEKFGKSIAQIFASNGETAFRACERQVMMDLFSKTGFIVATGGGCILDQEVRDHLSKEPGVIWLTGPVEILGKRIVGSDRPSLTGHDIEKELGFVLAQRQSYYQCCSKKKVDTAALSIKEVADVIQCFWKKLSNNNFR